MTQRQEDRAGEVSLDDLFNEAQLAAAAKNQKRARVADPSLRESLDAAAKKMRELYTLPENWQRTRGVALIDKATQSLVGNFSEYCHVSLPKTRKLLREHTPISIDATEVVEGYLGDSFHQRLGMRQSWTEERTGTADILLDELQVGAPSVPLLVRLRLGALMKVRLQADCQLASASGNTLLHLPAGCCVLDQLSTDSRAAVRKAIGL